MGWRFSRPLLWLALLLSNCVPGQPADEGTSSQVVRPVMGYVFDTSAQALRQVIGIPGAARLGVPVDLGFPLAGAAATREYALVLDAEGRARVAHLNVATPDSQLIEGIPAGATRVILSPAGSAAVLEFASGRSMIAVQGLPDAPILASAVDLSILQASPRVAAVSDDGAVILVSAGAGQNELWLWTGSQGLLPFPPGVTATAAAFIRGTRDALLADAATNTVALVRDVTGSAAIRLLAGPDYGIRTPIAVASSPDGARVYVLGADKRVAVLDLTVDPSAAMNPTNAALPSLNCPCNPSQLTPLGTPSLLRLNEPGSGPLWLLDTSGPRPRIVFVPPGPAGAGGADTDAEAKQ